MLQLRLAAESKSVEPLHLNLNAAQRLIVISGPNAGGKSVALKTTGLLQYMLQSGFLLPLAAESRMMHFENIFADIGDDQSIESDLSTYSSHLKAAKHIVNFSNPETLVLMDEIGTGTDPTFGGPIAEAVLEAIHEKGAYGLITTHFSNIKSKASELVHVVNAAMLFDTEKLQPQYKLILGQAGSSFAFEVASNIGLNKKLINKAKRLTHTQQYDLDKMLAEVQLLREELQEEKRKASEQSEKAGYFIQEYKELKEELETQKGEIIRNAKAEAQNIIGSANKDIEHTIRIIKEKEAGKAETKRVREDLGRKRDALNADSPKIKRTEFRIGDLVRIIDSSSTGEIISLKKNKAEVIIGSVKTRINTEKLEHLAAKQEKAVKRYIGDKSYLDRQKNFSSELDIRGLRTEEALKTVEEWIDSAIILGFERLRLIHGKGDGILKQQIRTFLKPNPSVLKISFERVDLGGEGVSIIELR
jgi:DNA mismatch repair protein MutS2